MEYRTLTHTALLLVFVASGLTLDAHSGTGSIVARDTDKVSALRNKLAKLSSLLALLDDGDENDLQKVVEQKKTQPPPKVPLVSEDMGVEDHRQDSQALTLPPKPQKPAAQQQNTKPLVPPDSSIRTLAKALSRLEEPDFNKEDSTGDHLGTENNEAGSNDQRSEEMEQVIEQALERLDQDKRQNTISKKPSGGVGSNLLKNPDGLGSQVKEQGLKMIESRLMHDILLANNLGISVDDIIQDLDNRASKEAKLKKIEDELNDLSSRK